MSEDDPKLIERCLRGEPSAWNALVDRYSRLVYSVIHRHRFSSADAEDLFQTTFILLYRNLDRVKDQARLAAWLVTATQRECWRLGRRRRKLAEVAQGEEAGEPDPDEVEAFERQQIVQQSLTELGGRCEELLRAMFMDPQEPDYEAISARLNMPIGSIGPTRARCFEKLQTILRGRGVTDEPPSP